MGIQNKAELNPKNIEKILGKIRTKGIRDLEVAKEFLQLLTDTQEWTSQECKNFCKSMFIHYIKDKDDLKLILFVSGFANETYGYMKNAATRRKEFLDELEKTDANNKHYMSDPETLRRSVEQSILKNVAERMYVDFESGLLPKLIEEWVSGEKILNAEGLLSIQSQDVNISNDIVERNININIEEKAILNINVHNKGGICEISRQEQTAQVHSHSFLGTNIPVDEIFLSSDEPILRQGSFYQIKATVLPIEAIGSPLNCKFRYRCCYCFNNGNGFSPR